MDGLMQFLHARLNDAMLGLLILVPGVCLGAALAYLTSEPRRVGPGMEPMNWAAWYARLTRRPGK